MSNCSLGSFRSYLAKRACDAIMVESTLRSRFWMALKSSVGLCKKLFWRNFNLILAALGAVYYAT